MLIETAAKVANIPANNYCISVPETQLKSYWPKDQPTGHQGRLSTRGNHPALRAPLQRRGMAAAELQIE